MINRRLFWHALFGRGNMTLGMSLVMLLFTWGFVWSDLADRAALGMAIGWLGATADALLIWVGALGLIAGAQVWYWSSLRLIEECCNE